HQGEEVPVDGHPVEALPGEALRQLRMADRRTLLAQLPQDADARPGDPQTPGAQHLAERAVRQGHRFSSHGSAIFPPVSGGRKAGGARELLPPALAEAAPGLAGGTGALRNGVATGTLFGHRSGPLDRMGERPFYEDASSPARWGAHPGRRTSSGAPVGATTSPMISVSPSPAHTSASAAASLRLVDGCGVFLSGLCALHCAVTPLLVGVLPAIAGEGTETNLRRVLIVLGLGGVAFGALFHRDRRAFVPLAGALMLAALLEVGAIVPAWEVFVSLALSGLLITAHALNTRACNAHCHGCSPARFWTARVEELGASRVSSGVLAMAAAILLRAVGLAGALRARPSVVVRPEPVASAEIEVDWLAATPVIDAEPEAVTPAPERLDCARDVAPVSAPVSGRDASHVAPPAASRLADSLADSVSAAAPSPHAENPKTFDDLLVAHAPEQGASEQDTPVSFDRVLTAPSGSALGAGGSQGGIAGHPSGRGTSAAAAPSSEGAR